MTQFSALDANYILVAQATEALTVDRVLQLGSRCLFLLKHEHLIARTKPSKN